MAKRTKTRVGDEVVTEERESAIIDYDDIIAAAEVEQDHVSIGDMVGDYNGHSCEPVPRYGREYDPSDRNDVANTRDGYYIIELDAQAEKCLEESYNYLRAAGASRQVAREKIAEQRRETIKRLVRYYAEDWCYVYVVVKFRDYHDSLHGIESDYDDYIEEVKRELADQVVAELERDGYTVENKPTEISVARRNHRNRVNIFNTSGR